MGLKDGDTEDESNAEGTKDTEGSEVMGDFVSYGGKQGPLRRQNLGFGITIGRLNPVS